eukprot:Nk52_evm1s689 gene=Nk52_evmTU1s689
MEPTAKITPGITSIESANDLLTFQKQCPPKVAFKDPLKPSEAECRDYSLQFWTDYVLQDSKDLSEDILDLLYAPFLATLNSKGSPPCSPMDYECDRHCVKQRKSLDKPQEYFPWLHSQKLKEPDRGILKQIFSTQSYWEMSFEHTHGYEYDKTSQPTRTLKSGLDQGLKGKPLEPPFYLALLLSTVIVHSMINGDWLGDSQQVNTVKSLLQGNKPNTWPWPNKPLPFLTSLTDSHFNLKFASTVRIGKEHYDAGTVSTYKIHITPRWPYYFSVLRAIIRARENDVLLKRTVHHIKVCVYLSKLHESYNKGAMIAPIVIYLQQEEESSPEQGFRSRGIPLGKYWYLMRQKLFIVLENLFTGLKKCLDPDGDITHRSLHEKYGSGLIVRGNYPFTKLINVAHYLGDDNPDYFDKLNNEWNYEAALNKFPESYGEYKLDGEARDIAQTQYYKAKNKVLLDPMFGETTFDFLPISLLERTSNSFFFPVKLVKRLK